jgi:hypothetical protein
MRVLLWVFIAAIASFTLASGLGCRKAKKTSPTTPATAKTDDTTVTPGPGGGVVVGGGGGGGSGGAVQAVRKAVDRTQVRAALADMRLAIENYEITNGRMPTPQETLAMVRQSSPKYAKLIDDQAIVLHAARTRQDVWAYEGKPPGSNYLVLTNQGVEEMDGQTLRQKLGGN